MYTDTFYKLEKKLREKILIRLIKKYHKKGFSYKYFIQLIKSDHASFSRFMNLKQGIHKKKIEILENFFGIQSQTKKKI